MAAKKTTAPALAVGQTVMVVQYAQQYGPDRGKILRMGSGEIKRVGRTLIDICYRLDGREYSTTETFTIATGDAKDYHQYPLRFRTEAQLDDEARRGEALAVLAHHNLRSVGRNGLEAETDLSSDTLVKIAAVITEAEEA